ncbi:MAG: 6-carboxytetrahydropterin synthase [Bacteroidetes bacterium]|nr:6-carboxytetrahydropterin synthase [Bacteroidota bacterium]
MITITKIFRFEAAHAIYRYPGSCANIHGHSYELHVSVRAESSAEGYIPGIGIIMDFKELKNMVQQNAIALLDHKVILSKAYLAEKKNSFSGDELTVMEAEPTAENLLYFILKCIQGKFPSDVKITSMKLWETRDSFAEWSA